MHCTKRKGWYLLLAVLILVQALYAQSVQEVQKRYASENAVFLNNERETNIYFKNEEPVAETAEKSDMLILSDRANGMYNKNRVYHGSFNQLLSLEAYTSVPDGNKYRTIKVTEFKEQNATSNSVFYDDTKESVFDFPSLVKGAIATEKHTEFNKDLHLLIPFYFSSYLPVANAKYTVTFPAAIQVKYIIKNDVGNNVKVAENRRGKQHSIQFTASNITSLDRFGDAPSRAYSEPHVIVYIANYKNSQGIEVPFLANVNDLYAWYSSLVKNVNASTAANIQQLSDSLTAGIFSEKEKTRQIYRWVQNNIKYVAFEDGMEGFVPRQAADVCNKRYGDCKDMASLLTSLLNAAGIKAYLTWIGTRDIPYDYDDVPLPIVDNHMICTASVNNVWIYLDGTDPNCIFEKPSKAIQGKQALIGINSKDFTIARVPELTNDQNLLLDSTNITIGDKGITGSSSVYFKGYFGVDLYNTLIYRDSKDLLDYVKGRTLKGSNKYILNNYEVERFNPLEKIVNIKTKFEVPDYGKKIADEIYINLALDNYGNTSMLDTLKRKVAVDNDFRFNVKNYTTLTIPDGYDVGFLPANYDFKNSLYAFSIQYKKMPGSIVAEQIFTSNVMMLEPQNFGLYNQAIKELNTQRKQQLVLKKK